MLFISPLVFSSLIQFTFFSSITLSGDFRIFNLFAMNSPNLKSQIESKYGNNIMKQLYVPREVGRAEGPQGGLSHKINRGRNMKYRSE